MSRNLAMFRRLIKNTSTRSFSITVTTKSSLKNLSIGSNYYKNRFPTSRFNFSSSIVTEKLDSLGDSITTAVLLSWSKEQGDIVKEDDVIAVVETDKVTMDIRAKKAGVFLKGCVESGAEISVGSNLYEIDTSGDVAVASSAASTTASSSTTAAAVTSDASGKKIEVPVPTMGESITQGILAKWNAKVGDSIQLDDVVASIETDKVTVDVRSPQAGVLDFTYFKEGEEVNVGSPLFVLSTDSALFKASAEKPAQAKASDETVVKEKPAAPKAAPSKPSTPSTTPASPTSNSENDRSETRVKMTRMRVRIAERLKESQNTAAMLTTFQEVDMSNLISLRNKYKEDFEKKHGVKLGFMSAFVCASTKALREIPAVNAVIDDKTNEIIYRNFVDVSVAVASPTGLVVPVLRNTEKMSFIDVEKSIAFYSKKAKDGSLAMEDMTGGSFTISNGGVFGSLMGTPIINPPQSAILGMHATKMRPVVVDGNIVARPMMYLALTYDHRLVDGREAVTFLKSIQNKIEDPSRLLLDL